MPQFENYPAEVASIEQEIVRKGIVLGIDWADEVQVRALAREALACRHDAAECQPDTLEKRSKIELFALAQLMLKVMAESADENIESHGGPVWKIFGRALWLESAGSFHDGSAA